MPFGTVPVFPYSLKKRGCLLSMISVLLKRKGDKGKVSFKPVLVRVLDAGMKKIEAECPDKGMELQVSD